VSIHKPSIPLLLSKIPAQVGGRRGPFGLISQKGSIFHKTSLFVTDLRAHDPGAPVSELGIPFSNLPESFWWNI